MGKNLTLEDHIKAIEKPIEVIAHVRRMAEVDGEDMETFDARLNKLCAEKHEMFEKMGEVELALYGLRTIIEAGRGEELFRDILGKDE
ncbi:MAG: hypothetical protein U0L88_04360 [Acutalibacteraceae bacterium]|nr:hypothetical protein [Acutalibacteraceae bacterium]